MSKWKCDICNSEFNNYHAEGFNNKIYCPLCYYKHEYKDLKQQLSQLQQDKKELKEWLEEEINKLNPKKLELGELNLILDDVKFYSYIQLKEVLEKLGE